MTLNGSIIEIQLFLKKKKEKEKVIQNSLI